MGVGRTSFFFGIPRMFSNLQYTGLTSHFGSSRTSKRAREANNSEMGKEEEEEVFSGIKAARGVDAYERTVTTYSLL